MFHHFAHFGHGGGPGVFFVILAVAALVFAARDRRPL
jgi:hypothetical protein